MNTVLQKEQPFAQLVFSLLGFLHFCLCLWVLGEHSASTRNNKEQSIQSETNHVYSNTTREERRDSATPETKGLNAKVAETQSPELDVSETKNSDLNTSETKEPESYVNSDANQEIVIYFSGGKIRIVGQEQYTFSLFMLVCI